MEKKFKDDLRYIYQKKLDIACFQHDMACGYFKGLLRRKASYKLLRNKEFNVAKIVNLFGYQNLLVEMVYKFN